MNDQSKPTAHGDLVERIEVALDCGTLDYRDGAALADEIVDDVIRVLCRAKGGSIAEWEAVLADYRSRLAQKLGDTLSGLIQSDEINDVLAEEAGE